MSSTVTMRTVLDQSRDNNRKQRADRVGEDKELARRKGEESWQGERMRSWQGERTTSW